MEAEQKSPKVENVAKSRSKSLNISNPKVLIGLSVFLALIGGTVIDPTAGFMCFVLAGILALFATLFGRKRLRYIALLLLITIIIFTVLKFSEARNYISVYRSRAESRGVE